MSTKAIYWSIAGVLAVLLVVMLTTYQYDRSSAAAEAKAQELVTAYRAAGLPTPVTTDRVARVLGDDGGAVCATAASPHQLGLLKTRLGVGGEFYLRPAAVDARTVQGLLLIVRIYCPENLPTVERFVADFAFSPVVTG